MNEELEKLNNHIKYQEIYASNKKISFIFTYKLT